MPRAVRRRIDPRWTIIRRIRFAYRVRDAVYGCTARPFGRKLRTSWARFLSHYTRSRALTYGEVLEIANGLGAELRFYGRTPTPGDGPEDLMLRLELSKRFVEATRRKAAMEPRYLDRLRRRQQRVHRTVGWMKQALLDAGCPIDGLGGLDREKWRAAREEPHG